MSEIEQLERCLIDLTVRIDQIVNCGGLAVKNSLLMQIYADITGRPMKVSRSEQTPALGAAMFGAISAGKEISGYSNMIETDNYLLLYHMRVIRDYRKEYYMAEGLASNLINKYLSAGFRAVCKADKIMEKSIGNRMRSPISISDEKENIENILSKLKER